MKMRMKYGVGLLMILMLILNFAACGGKDSAGNSASSSASSTAQYSESDNNADYMTGEAAEEYDGESSTGGLDAVRPENPRQNRKLITTVHLSAETQEYDDFLTWLDRRLEEAGGYMESSEMDSYNSRRRICQLTLRVPADQLNGFLSGVEENCNVVSRSRQEEDVTLNYVDAESYKQALQVEEARLMELLEQAQNLEDILNIEDRLATVRAQLQSYESTLRVYDNQIDYSTVYMSVQEVADLTEPEPESWLSRAWTGMKGNARDLGRFFQELGLFLVAHLPTIIFLVAIVGIILLFTARPRRRARERREAQKRLLREMRQGQAQEQAPPEDERQK